MSEQPFERFEGEREPEVGVKPKVGFVDFSTIKSKCGLTNEAQDVELYDGTLGVTKAFVRAHQRPVGQLQWNNNLATIYTNPGNVNGVEWCSGTLIGADLFLTAGHCFDDVDNKGWVLPRINGTGTIIPSQDVALNMHVNFNFQRDSAGNLRTATQVAIVRLVEYRLEGLDYAIVQLAGNPGAEFGIASISRKDALIDDIVAIIGHPDGEPKQIEAGHVRELRKTRIRYNDIDTLGGNSGSGILHAKSGLIVGVHTNGGCKQTPSVTGFNVGHRISALLSVSPTLSRPFSDDIAFLREDNASWYIVNGATGENIGAPWWGHHITGWPGNGRYFIGDFNGDGTDDIAFLREDNASWYIVNGATGENIGAPWWGHHITGWPGNGRYFIGDFNGDGTDDIAFLREDNNSWYIVNGATGENIGAPWWGHHITGWPGNGRYFIGDFNGDGTDDIAFLREDNASWYIVNGATGENIGAPWWGHHITGWPGNGRYFIGDFNGDGTDDIAFLREDNASWYIVNGATGENIGAPWWGHHITGWPGNGRYFIGDFNGDGTDDIAFLREDNNSWYIVNGATGENIGARWWGHHITGWPGNGRYFIGNF